MKRLILAVAVSLAATGGAHALTCQTVGDNTFCDDGTTQQRVGDTTYINPGYRPGQAPRPAVVCQRVGDATFCD